MNLHDFYVTISRFFLVSYIFVLSFFAKIRVLGIFWKKMKFQIINKFSMYPDFMKNLSLVKSNVFILWLLNIQDANFHPIISSFLEVT